MILARLTQAIRDQSWFAVGLEFLIVILGVVIGFQVTAWNAARQDIALERAYLERLSSELAAVQVELVDTQGDLDDARDEAVRFLAALEAGDFGAMQADAPALLSITQVPEVQAQSAAIHELISSGRLGLIRNDDLRAMLADLPLIEAEAHSRFDQIRDQQVDIVAELRPLVRIQMDGYQVTSVTLSDGVVDDTEVLANTLAYAIYENRGASLFTAVLTSKVEALREALDHELGVERPEESTP